MNENANNTDATHSEDSTSPSPAAGAPLTELEQLIGELQIQVSALREGEFDAVALEQRLRELNELAVRAAAALDSATR